MILRVLVGATGSGKKTVAAELSRRHGLSILSMDSMKVYRGMDIGTDKPTVQVQAETPFHLVDLVGHDESFSAGRWVEAAVSCVEDQPGEVLFAGGTPLYLRLMLRGLIPGPPADEALRTELDAAWDEQGEDAVRAELRLVDAVIEARLQRGDRKRVLRALEVWRLTGRPMSEWQQTETRPPIPGRFVVTALRHAPAAQQRRVAARVERMLADGLVAEVESLKARAPFAAEPGRCIGYAEALAHLAGTLDAESMAERIVTRTRQLVRKQRMFLASFPEVRWIDVPEDVEIEALVNRVEDALELGSGRRSG